MRPAARISVLLAVGWLTHSAEAARPPIKLARPGAKVVVLLSSNAKKAAEYQARLKQYGLTLRVETADADPGRLLQSDEVLGVLRDETNIYDREGKVALEDRPAPATNRTRLLFHYRDERGAVRSRTYEGAVQGVVEPPRRQVDPGHDWDDVFRPERSPLSLLELAKRGLKVSARDRAISQLARDVLWFPQRKNWAWGTVQTKRAIDFSTSVPAVIASHPILSRVDDRYGLRNVVAHVVQDGTFLRSAANRRQWIYWNPGLNGGIPLTPKKDPFHEATYAFHDLMHLATPDLVFDGNASEAHRKVYLVHRMMGEAFSLVLADMLFVDSLRQQGYEYDYSKRQIHPLFASLKIDATKPEDLRRLLYANARYCLAGDDGPYRELGADATALASFKQKYEQFFIADYKWTHQNFVSMTQRLGGVVAKWMASTKTLREGLPTPLETVDSYAERMRQRGVDLTRLDSLIDGVFAHYYERLTGLMRAPPEVPTQGVLSERGLRNGFVRYITGQMAAFAAFDFVPETKIFERRLLAEMKRPGPWTQQRIAKARGIMDSYFAMLERSRLISPDDRETYREVFPVFDPYYVKYDTEVTTGLDKISRALIERAP